MNKITCLGVLSALAFGLSFSAFAATPVAVWDGDFSKTISGYTLDLNGNTAEEGAVTIGNTGGIKISFSAMDTITVIYRYSDLSLGQEQAIATFKSTHSETHVTNGNAVGVELTADNKTMGMWEGAQHGSAGSAVSATSGKFAVTYKPKEPGGTYLYTIANGSLTQVYGVEGLRSYKYVPEGVNVGGKDAGLPATGMKISAIAIFSGILSEDEMANYLFPSEQKKENAYLWLDASADDTIVTNTSGSVTSWMTRSLSGKAATAYAQSTQVTAGPSVSSAALAGMNVVDFGAARSHEDLKFDETTSIRTVFMVAAVATDDNNVFFLGDNNSGSKTFHFHRGGGGKYFDSDHGSKFTGAGCVRRNGEAVTDPANTVVPTSYGLYTLTASSAATANCICQDRDMDDRNGGKRIAELIVFTCELTDEARDEIEDYLLEKWFPKYKAIVTQSANWSDLAWTPSVPPSGEDVILINNGADGVTTVTVDSPVTVGKLTVESAEGKELELARFGANMTAGSFDFSKAKGGVGIGVKDGWAVTDALRNYIRDNDVEVAFHGADDRGATLAYALDLNKSIQGHIAFEGGRHALTYGNSVQNGALFGANASLENPTILVKGGTTLDFTGKDLCGWSGAADKNGVIRVEKGGRINMKDSGGTVYYRQRIALDPGAEFYIDMAANNFRLQGGVTEGKEQLYVPASTAGTAYIKPTDASRDSIYLAKDETRGFGVFVGAGSTLDIRTKLACQEDAENRNNFEIAKRGAGTLKLSGDISGYWNHGYDGAVVKFSVYAGDMELAMAEAVKSQIWFESGSNLKLTGNGTRISGYLDGPGKVVCNTTGEIVLSGANTYSGGTDILSGVLVLGNASALGTGLVTVASGAQLDLNGKAVTASFAGNGTICNSSANEASVNGIRVRQGESIPLADGLSIHLDAGKTLTLVSIPPVNKVKIGGEGRVEYASASVPTLPAGLWAEDWTGTFAWSGYDGNIVDWDPTSYYNGTKSVFEFGGKITYYNDTTWPYEHVKSYFRARPFSLGELVLAKGSSIGFNDGYTTPSKGDETVNNYCFTRLSGSGMIDIATITTASPGLKFGDVSAFTGTIKNNGSDGSGYRILLGDGDLVAVGDDPSKAAIHFTGNATLVSANLYAQSGHIVHPYATLTMAGYPIFYSSALTFRENAALCLKDHNSKATCHWGVAIDAGLTIPVTILDAKGLAVGESLIIWNATPAGDFALNVGPGLAKGTPGLVASKTADGLVTAADDTKTFFEIGDTAAADRPTTIFENRWLKDAGVWPDAATVDEIQDNLDTPNAAGIAPGQAYLAGFAADEVADAAVTLGIALLPDSDKVRIHATGLPPAYARRNNALVTYVLLSTPDLTDWTSPQRTDMGLDTTVDVDRDGEEQFYRVSAEIELSTGSTEIIAIVPSANIVASGTPLLTEPGTQFAAALGSATLAEETETMTFQLAGAGVVEGQAYHLEVNEPVGGDYQAPRTYGVIAHVLSDKTITFDFGHTVAAGTTVKLTLLSDSGAADGNVRAVSVVQPSTSTSTFSADTIVANRVGTLPLTDGLPATAEHNGYRIPALATDGEGEVVACYDTRYFENSGYTDLGNTAGIDIGESYSADGGITFDKPRLGVDVENYYTWDCQTKTVGNRKYMDIGDVSVVWDPSRQQYWMIGITGRGLTGLSDTSQNDVVVYTRKKGRGTAWTPWHNPALASETNPILYRSIQNLIMTQRKGYGRGFLQGPGHGMIVKIGSKDGTTIPVGTVVFPVQYFFEGNGQSSAGAIYLKPGAETTENNWVSTSRTNNDGSQENCIMELDDGSWYMMCKNSTSYKAFRSTDYTNWVDVDDGLFRVAHVQGSCLKIGTKDGVGQYVFCHANASNRSNLTLFFGSDTTRSSAQELNKGINWKGLADKIVIDATDAGGMTYNSMCMLDDHTLGILWETNWHIQFTRIDVSNKVD